MGPDIGFQNILECRLLTKPRNRQPCSIIIFGATGELTHRKLIPALYHLFKDGLLPDPIQIIGVARREKLHDEWRKELYHSLQQYSRTKPIDEKAWDGFASLLSYLKGDINQTETYKSLSALLHAASHDSLQHNRLFYLAIPPSQFAPVIEGLTAAGLVTQDPPVPYWNRIIVEKPFGHDLQSARELNRLLMRYVREHQIFRIDHYLGKETVQNILLFRFSNAIFEELWSRASIDHIQVTVSEKQGIGSRGPYYEEVGALRDIFQNHLLQLLALIAMEPPVSLEPESIRDEKVKLLRSIRQIPADKVDEYVARGQYCAGYIDGQPVLGYRQEPGVSPTSNVETFVALKLYIDNWRWAEVPFFIRTGKRLPLSASEIVIRFRSTPNVLFAALCGQRLEANALILRLQPNEGILLIFNGKVPGTELRIRPVTMSFSYDSAFGAYTPEAYERLLLDAIDGDPTLFIRRDEIEASWQIVDQIRLGWVGKPLTNREYYSAGTWGPVAAEELISKAGRSWRNPSPILKA